jgi:hypothetical protein
MDNNGINIKVKNLYKDNNTGYYVIVGVNNYTTVNKNKLTIVEYSPIHDEDKIYIREVSDFDFSFIRCEVDDHDGGL